MSGLAKLDDQYVPLQIKVFTRWVNTQLKGVSDHEIEDITKDLSNGVQLVQLAQVLTQKDAPRAWSKNPTNNYDQVTNCDLAIQMFENDGVQFVGISGKDVNDNNEKLILGLIWSLILKYSIGKSVANKDVNGEQAAQSNKSNKDALMTWAKDRVSNYPDMKDFKSYDLSMCALLDSYVPNRINYSQLNPEDTENNTKLATDVMNDLGIPVYIYPEDVVKNGDKIDEKTLLTQLSSAKVVLDNLPPEVLERGVNTDAAEEERLQREKEEQERKEKEEQERLAKEKEEQERKEREEQERLAREKEEQERKEREEAERLAREQAEAERLAKEKEEQERLAREKEEQERKEREEAERLAREQAEAERLAKEKEEQERLAKQQAEADRLAKQRDAAMSREEELNNLKSIVEQLRQNLSNVQSQADEATQKANEANQKVEDLSNENAHLRKDNRCLKYEVKKLKDGQPEADPTVSAVTYTNDDVNRMKGDVDDTKNAASQLQAENEQMKETIQKLRGDLKVLKHEVKKLKENAANDQQQPTERAITVNDIDVDQIKGDVENTKNSTSQLQVENEQMKQLIQQMESQINDLTSQIQSLPAQNVAVPDDFVQKINKASDDSNKAIEKADEASQNIENVKKQSDDVNTRVTELVNANNKLNREMNCMKYEVKKLIENTEEKDVPVETVPAGPEIPDDLLDRVDVAQNQSKLANEGADYAKNRANRADEKADGAGSKADEAIQKADSLRVENNKLKNDVRCLKYEIKKLKEQFENDANRKVASKENA